MANINNVPAKKRMNFDSNSNDDPPFQEHFKLVKTASVSKKKVVLQNKRLFKNFPLLQGFKQPL
ncbi:hypothetical protein SHA02_13550 [Salisediminibacterium halotolerans]|nr:hypothetical protein SHA02_13550 [Salisediminibacterium halotolerans]